MAYEDTYDYEGQADLIAQQAAKIKALRAMQPIETPGQQPGFRSAVTGAEMIGPYVKRPLLGSLAPALADYTATQQEGQMNAAKSALTKTQYDNAAKWIAAKPGNIADAVPDTQVPIQQGDKEPMGSFEGNPLKAISQMTDPVEQQRAMEAYRNQLGGNMKTVPGTAAIPATRQSLLDWSAAGQANPATRQLSMEALKDQLITQPGKESDRIYEAAQKALDRGATVEAARLKAIADRISHMETNQTTLTAAGIRAGKGADAITGTFNLVPGVTSSNGLPVERNNKTGETREVQPAPGTSFAPVQKPLSGAEADRQQKMISKMDNAHLLQQQVHAGAFDNSIWKNAASSSLGGIINWPGGGFDPSTHAAFAQLEELKADINHGIYGASFSGPEQQRAKQYQESAYSSPEALKRYTDHLVGMAERGYARQQALTTIPGAHWDAKIGAIVRKDGTIVDGTATPTFGNESANPTSNKPVTAPVTPPVNTPTEAPTSTPAPTQTVNGKSSLDINREAYNKAKNVYASRPTDANRNARDLARSDLERALNAAGSTEGEGIPEAVAQANKELGPTNFPRATAKKTTSQRADELLAKYK